MENKLPGVIVTGASGFIGGYFVQEALKQFRFFCLARRSQKEANIPEDENLHWLHADITKWHDLLPVIKYVKEHGGADYVLHLAGYYDFTMDDNPAYEETNVTGTQHILKMAQQIGIKRFVFSSSLAACKFPPYDQVLTEESPPDADFPYARSKRKGEKIIKEYSDVFPCSVIRLAAVYSDWCEYPPLYMLLKTWLSQKTLMSKVLGGRGESAVPYIHVKDVAKIFLQIFEMSEVLPKFAVYYASPPGSVSHQDLFKIATQYYYGRNIKPIHIPRLIAGIGLILRSRLLKFMGKEPFEKPWMAKYIDQKLSVDASFTYKALNWKPTSRYHILRRLLFLTERMKNHPENWAFRNDAILKRVAVRRSLIIYDILVEIRETVVEKIFQEIINPDNRLRFPRYQKLEHGLLKWYISLLFQLISTTVRNRDRRFIHNYAQIISSRRFAEGFQVKEVKQFVKAVRNHTSEALLARPELKGMEHRIYDYIHLTLQFIIDEIEDSFEILSTHPPESLPMVENISDIMNCEDIKRVVRQMEDFSGKPLENSLNDSTAEL